MMDKEYIERNEVLRKTHLSVKEIGPNQWQAISKALIAWNENATTKEKT
jgi:hypothetical protein